MDAVGYWLLGILIGVALLIAAYGLVIRPWHMTWGTVPEERHCALPGDDLIQRPMAVATHAITINAPAEKIWPWLVQMGQGRGGFYSYDWLENLFGCRINNADRVVPEWQSLAVGDGISLHPKAPPLDVTCLEPGRAIVLGGGMELKPDTPVDRSFLRLHTYRAFTWAFVLVPQQDNVTRFVVRVRVTWSPGMSTFLQNRIFLEPAHSIMQRKMNLGLKQRVEADHSIPG